MKKDKKKRENNKNKQLTLNNANRTINNPTKFHILHSITTHTPRK